MLQHVGDPKIGPKVTPHTLVLGVFEEPLTGRLLSGFDGEIGEAHDRQALALAEPRGMSPCATHGLFGLGKLYYRRAGKPVDVIDHLNAATTIYREMDMRLCAGASGDRPPGMMP